MSTKKTIIALSAGILVASTVPALADPLRPAWGHGYRDQPRNAVAVERRHRAPVREFVARRPAVQRVVVAPRHYVGPRPYVARRPVVVHREPAYRPAPHVYRASYGYHDPTGNAIGAIGGAILGAAIGNQIGQGEDRAATTAIGALIGGMIGSSW